MFTFDLTLTRNYRIKAKDLNEAVGKLKQFAQEEITINNDRPAVITDTHESGILVEF